MNVTEANRVIRELQIVRPSVADWLENLPSPEETLEHWRRTIGTVSYEDAAEVVTQIADGEIEVAGYEIERLPAILRRKALEVAKRRQWLKPIEQRPEQQQRYDCHLCRDDGRVIVAHWLLVRAMLAGGIEHAKRCPYQTASALCRCARGGQQQIDRREIAQANRLDMAVARLDDPQNDPMYVIYEFTGGQPKPSPPSDAFYAALAAWCEEQRTGTQQRFEERHAWVPKPDTSHVRSGMWQPKSAS
jgi:hypothetical protein